MDTLKDKMAQLRVTRLCPTLCQTSRECWLNARDPLAFRPVCESRWSASTPALFYRPKLTCQLSKEGQAERMKFRFEYATRSYVDPTRKIVVEAPNVMEALALHPEVLRENVVRLNIYSYIEAEISHVSAVYTVYYTCVCGTQCECVLGDGEGLESYQTGCCGASYRIWVDNGEAKLEQVGLSYSQIGDGNEAKMTEKQQMDSYGDPFLPDWKDE